jgi:hypothetical protein
MEIVRSGSLGGIVGEYRMTGIKKKRLKEKQMKKFFTDALTEAGLAADVLEGTGESGMFYLGTVQADAAIVLYVYPKQRMAVLVTYTPAHCRQTIRFLNAFMVVLDPEDVLPRMCVNGGSYVPTSE